MASSALPLASHAALEEACGSSRIAFFLDYDGTLAPIVDQPDLAFISEECRAALRSLAGAFPVALVSGRSNEKLRAFLEIGGVYLAGSHGVHIVGPHGEAIEGPDPIAMVGADALAALETARAALDVALSDVPGYLTENNLYCISAHYRMVDPSEHERVRDAVLAVLSQHACLCHKAGKMVHECALPPPRA